MHSEHSKSEHDFVGTLAVNGDTQTLIVKLTFNHKRNTFNITSKVTTKLVGFNAEERTALLNTQTDLTQNAIAKAHELIKESTVDGYKDSMFPLEEDMEDGDFEKETQGKVRPLGRSKKAVANEG
jgi:hypothetical protein